MVHGNYIHFIGAGVLAFSRKCATTSISNATKYYPGNVDRKLETPSIVDLKANGVKVVYFVRDPIQRLVSAYKYFQEPVWAGQVIPGVPFEDALIFMKDNFNPHWSPVAEEHSHEGVWVPTKTYLFDEINEVFPKEFKGLPLQKLNRGPKQPLEVSETAEFLIKTHWAQDIQLWETVRDARQRGVLPRL